VQTILFTQDVVTSAVHNPLLLPILGLAGATSTALETAAWSR
jgi:hypothetical protein